MYLGENILFILILIKKTSYEKVFAFGVAERADNY